MYMPNPSRLGALSRAHGGLFSSNLTQPSAEDCSSALRFCSASRSSGNHTPGCVSPASIACAKAATQILHMHSSSFDDSSWSVQGRAGR